MSKKENFIKKSKLIHDDKYGYSEVKYFGILNKVRIICPIHGEFEQTPHHHLHRKQGCPKCSYLSVSIKTRKSENIFINEAKLIHNNKYNYSKVEYKNSKTKVKIICPIHGVFEQTPDNHLNGQTCGKCNGKNKTTDEFIAEAKLIHGNKYDYSEVEYKNSKTKVKIICLEHGEFQQTPNAHIKLNQGCPKCRGKNKTTDEFIAEAKLIHGNKYDYSEVEYKNSKTKVKIICLEHGEFQQTPNMHLRNTGCPICRESKGEAKIRKFLNENNIKYIQEYSFNNCKNVFVLPFDFYLPEYNTCVEYDGIQHYKPINHFGGEKAFNITKQNDLIKTNYCNYNMISLIRIPYYNDVPDSLKNLLIK